MSMSRNESGGGRVFLVRCTGGGKTLEVMTRGDIRDQSNLTDSAHTVVGVSYVELLYKLMC